MEHAGPAVSEVFSVPDGLVHGFLNVQPFHPLTFDMNAGKPCQIGDGSERERPAAPNGIPGTPEDFGQFPFSSSAFALRTFADFVHPLIAAICKLLRKP